jgi:uncharacterized membrane protein YfcA
MGLLLLGYLIGWVLVLAHELGHALPMLRFTTGPVLVQVGEPSKSRQVRLRRLTYSLAPIAPGGFAQGPRGRIPRKQALAIIAGGPAMDLLVAVAGWYLVGRTSGELHEVALGVAILSTLTALGNLTPRWAHSVTLKAMRPSDGLRIKCLLKREQPVRPAARSRDNNDLTRGQVAGVLLGGVLGGLFAAGHGSLPVLFFVGAALHTIPTLAHQRRSRSTAAS